MDALVLNNPDPALDSVREDADQIVELLKNYRLSEIRGNVERRAERMGYQRASYVPYAESQELRPIIKLVEEEDTLPNAHNSFTIEKIDVRVFNPKNVDKIRDPEYNFVVTNEIADRFLDCGYGTDIFSAVFTNHSQLEKEKLTSAVMVSSFAINDSGKVDGKGNISYRNIDDAGVAEHKISILPLAKFNRLYSYTGETYHSDDDGKDYPIFRLESSAKYRFAVFCERYPRIEQSPLKGKELDDVMQKIKSDDFWRAKLKDADFYHKFLSSKNDKSPLMFVRCDYVKKVDGVIRCIRVVYAESCKKIRINNGKGKWESEYVEQLNGVVLVEGLILRSLPALMVDNVIDSYVNYIDSTIRYIRNTKNFNPRSTFKKMSVTVPGNNDEKIALDYDILGMALIMHTVNAFRTVWHNIGWMPSDVYINGEKIDFHKNLSNYICVFVKEFLNCNWRNIEEIKEIEGMVGKKVSAVVKKWCIRQLYVLKAFILTGKPEADRRLFGQFMKNKKTFFETTWKLDDSDYSSVIKYYA